MNPDDDRSRSFFVEAIEGACRFVDWWFTPRWRALLTWVIAAAVSAYVFEEWGHQALRDASRYVVQNYLPDAFSASSAILRKTWLSMGTAWMLCWFQPLALRLGWVRSLLWLTLMGIGFSVEGGLFSTLLLLTFLSILMLGRRSRPWFLIPAFFLFASSIPVRSALPQIGIAKEWMIFNFFFALILLFGTEPIERRDKGGSE